MTSFVTNDNEYLEYNGTDIPITKQVASIYDFKIKGDVSLNFKIPNNATNRKVLGYYGAMDLNKPALSKKAFNIVRNGNFLMSGFIVIQADDTKDLDCFFMSGNANWFNAFKDNIADIDMNDFTVKTTAIPGRISASSGIVYPIVDYAYNGLKTGNWFVALAYEADEFDGEHYPEILPCVYLHSIVTKLANYANVKIEGDVMTDPNYLNIVITPYSANPRWPDSFVNASYMELTRTTNQTMVGGGYDQIEYDVISYGDTNRYNTSTWAYTAFVTATYKVEFDMDFSVDQAYAFRGYVDGVYTGSKAYDTKGIQGTTGVTQIWVNLVKGEVLTLYVQGTANFDIVANSTIRISIEEEVYTPWQLSSFAGTFVSANCILKDLKGIDLIKAINVLFGAESVYDVSSKTLSINKIDAINTYEDWSEYYISHRINHSTGVAKHNYITYANVADEDITRYNSTTNKKFASADIEVNTDIMELRDIASLPFGPCRDVVNTKLWQMPYVPLVTLSIDETFAFTGVSNNGGKAQFTGTGFGTFYASQVVYVESSVTETYNGFHILDPTGPGGGGIAINSTTDYVHTESGRISSLKVSLKDSSNRLLFSIPSYAVSDISPTLSDYDYRDQSVGTTNNTTLHAPWFYKQPNGVTFDDLKTSLAFDDLVGVVYNNVTMSELYHSKIKKMISSPKILTTLRLPEAVFKSFNSGKFINLNTKDLQGSFYVNKIDNYLGAKDTVEVELIRI